MSRPSTAAQATTRDIAISRTGRHTAFAFATLIALSLVIGLVFMQPVRPKFDAIRYITYALNLAEHGVFSSARTIEAGEPAPGDTHAPLYPAWLALFVTLDTGLRDSLICVVKNERTREPCALDLSAVVAPQLVLAGLLFGCVWLLGYRLSGSLAVAWAAALFAMLSKRPLDYANLILTEALLLPLLAALAVFLMLAYQTRQARWMLAAGVALGLAALTRPAYAYLFYAMAAVLAAAAVFPYRRGLAVAAILFAVAYGIVVAPWMIRNKRQFDHLSLTSGYAGDILSQRLAYNRMSWGEFGVAFVYWFPDFGDSLAAAMFPERYYKRLGWGEGSYYATTAPALYRKLVREAGGPDRVVGYALRTEILADPVKHALVSLPLAYRAVFISRYWGIIGFLCFIVVVVRQARNRDYTLLLLSLPIWFMVAFHAFVSVSIPRYNLALIPFYAFAMGWIVVHYGCRVLTNLRQRMPVR